MTRTLFALFVTVLFVQSAAYAVDSKSTQVADLSDSSLQLPTFNSLETHTSVSSHLLDDIVPHIKAGWNSQNDAPRGSEHDGGHDEFLGKQEWYLGGKLKSGWALSFMYTSYQYAYNVQNAKHIDGFQVGDPSVTIGFPTAWKKGSWSLNHQFRYYYPVSHYYVGKQIQNVAYYQFLNGALPNNNEFMNISIERYWYEPNYKGPDSIALWEDRTQIGHRFSPWFRSGIGQWTQNEFHSQSADGLCMDVYPFADFIVSKNLYMGPRYSFPVIASGSVFQGPQNVSLKEGFLEFWLQASI